MSELRDTLVEIVENRLQHLVRYTRAPANDIVDATLTAVADAVNALSLNGMVQRAEMELSLNETQTAHFRQLLSDFVDIIVEDVLAQAESMLDFPKDGIDEAAADALREPHGSIHVLTQEESEAEDRAEGKEED